MPTVTAQQTRWCELFGDVGKFVVLFDLLHDGSPVYEASRAIGVSEGTARTILKIVPEKYGVAYSVYTARPGRKTKGSRAGVTLSKEGLKLHDKLTQLLKRDTGNLGTPVAPQNDQLRLAIPDGPFLSTLLQPFVTHVNESAGSSQLLRVTVPYSDLLHELQAEKTEEFDAAVTWYETQTINDTPQKFRHWDISVFNEHTFELLLVSRTRELRGLVAKIPRATNQCADRLEWFVNGDDIHKAGGDIAVPIKQFPAAARWLNSLRKKVKIVPAESVGAVFAKVIAGDAAYGVLPSYYEVLDRYRVTDLLHYAKFLPDATFTNKYGVALLTKPGDDRFHDLKARLANRLKACLTVSHLSKKAEHRDLPTTPRDYTGNFYSYYIETIATQEGVHNAEWNFEVIRFKSEDVAIGDKSTGGHSVILKHGLLVNDSRVVFQIHGGVIGHHTLYILADHHPSQTAERLRQKLKTEWKELDELLNNHSNYKISTSTAGNAVPSFVALLPYYRKLTKPNGQKVRVWSGFWLGINSLYHPLANAMIIADRPLDRSNLDQISQDMRIRFMMAGAGFAGQMAEKANEDTNH